MSIEFDYQYGHKDSRNRKLFKYRSNVKEERELIYKLERRTERQYNLDEKNKPKEVENEEIIDKKKKNKNKEIENSKKLSKKELYKIELEAIIKKENEVKKFEKKKNLINLYKKK